MSWDDHGTVGTHLVAGSTGAAHRRLVTDILPKMEGVVDKLSAGAEVIDVGCGSGVAITELAKAYPASRFLGIDPSPMAPLLYGISIAFCMSSAMSKPDGAGLGTMGFSAEVAEKMTQQAGFSQFRMLDYEEGLLNAFYEVRP